MHLREHGPPVEFALTSIFARMILFSNAKINLGLEVVRQRQDGYRDIESVFCPVDFCDVLESHENPQGEDELIVSGLAIPGDPRQNLCFKALKALRKRVDVPPQRIHLLKAIPMGAGLGGGSADAAFLIKGLNEKYKFGLSEAECARVAAEVGSDCPFFIYNVPALVTGRGEHIEPIELDLGQTHVLIALPGIHVDTAQAYAHTQPMPPKTGVAEAIRLPLTEWKKHLRNRFEEHAFSLHPEIGKIKEAMYDAGAVYASMTGSGSAVIGLFAHRTPAVNFGGGVTSVAARPLGAK